MFRSLAGGVGWPACRRLGTEPETKDGARRGSDVPPVVFSSPFSTSWDLLSATARQAAPRAIWISVHNGCPSADAETTRVIKSVLVFGNAAIVTETIAGANSRLGETEEVFDYINGR